MNIKYVLPNLKHTHKERLGWGLTTVNPSIQHPPHHGIKDFASKFF